MSDALTHFANACRRCGVRPTESVLFVSVAQQTLHVLRRQSEDATPRGDDGANGFPLYVEQSQYRISTSRFGTGQENGSRRTPLGLHCIAEKIGAGMPVGTVFEGRQPVGFTWEGRSDAPIAHRILWLDGLEPEFNRGGTCDTHARYIYIHGIGDETTLGQPASQGCIHMSAEDLLPLHDRLPVGSLVWIHEF